MVTHEQNILVLHHLAESLPLLYHGGWLVAGVPGAPPQVSAGVLVDHLQSGVLQTPQGCGVRSVGVLRVRYFRKDGTLDSNCTMAVCTF